MRTTFATLRFWFLALCGGTTWVAVLKSAPPRAGAEVLVAANTMAIPDGLRPSPGNPIYYRFAQTQQPLGSIVAGIKLPSPAKVESAVVAELNKQGFVRARIGGPSPTIYILAAVGDANFTPATEEEVAFYLPAANGNVDVAAWLAFKNSPRFKDKALVDTIIGLNQAQDLSNDKARRLQVADNQDRYYITVIAFDAVLMAKNEKRVLWRTSMSIAFNNDFELTLPTMLASGGPFFGRDLKEPEFIGDGDRRKADVQIGELSVVPDDKKDSKQSKKEMGR